MSNKKEKKRKPLMDCDYDDTILYKYINDCLFTFYIMRPHLFGAFFAYFCLRPCHFFYPPFMKCIIALRTPL